MPCKNRETDLGIDHPGNEPGYRKIGRCMNGGGDYAAPGVAPDM